MSNSVRDQGAPEQASTPPESRARKALLKRLADVVSLPASRVNAFERAMPADLLVEMLRAAEPEERARVASRLAPLSEIPNTLVRLLLRDRLEIAALLIDDCGSLTDADLVACCRDASPEHRVAIASRRGVSEVVAEPLVEVLEPPVIAALLKRAELRPSGAYIMFWWCDADARKTILQRFAVSREVLQEAVDDVFALGTAEAWSDPLARKALQFIERRQRNRAAIVMSPFGSLEEAGAAGGAGGARE